MVSLFDPLAIGGITAPNRIFMAPLTRARANRDAVPQPVVADYYAQRAGAGLNISEATGISRQGLGWPNAPGLWSAAQGEGWKSVTDAVHGAGGRIFAQLWHMGRVAHPLVSGMRPVSSSAVAAPGQMHTYEGKADHVVPHALDTDEIAGIVADYGAAARNALRAGFDGVQIHAANGYLIDQFLRDGVNQRDDDYGGSPENRVRFLREVLDAVVAEAGAARTAIRFSPNGETQGTDDSDPVALFKVVGEVVAGRGLAFVEMREARPDSSFRASEVPPISPWFRKLYDGPLVLNGDYTSAEAAEAVASGRADAIAFGRPFLGNPDLPLRIRDGHPFAGSDMKLWYTNGPEGYSDYPTWEEAQAAA